MSYPHLSVPEPGTPDPQGVKKIGLPVQDIFVFLKILIKGPRDLKNGLNYNSNSSNLIF
jgi:hypothetical protein